MIPFPRSFSPELLDRVFYELIGRQKDLQARSVVCRAWRPEATPYLFGVLIHLNLARKKHVSNEKIRALPSFIRFITPPPFPASFITRIEMTSIPRISLLQQVLQGVSQYPNARELLLSGITFTEVTTDTLNRALSGITLPMIDRLRLKNSCFLTLEQFLSFISIFTTMSFLELHRVWYGARAKGENHLCMRRTFLVLNNCERIVLRCHSSFDGSPSFATSISRMRNQPSVGTLVEDALDVFMDSITHLAIVEHEGKGEPRQLGFVRWSDYISHSLPH